MTDFFKMHEIVVDVQEGKIYDPTGKVMQLDFINMTMKPFNTRTKLSPIRFNDSRELLWWNHTYNKWVSFKTYGPKYTEIIAKLVELKVEKELLG